LKVSEPEVSDQRVDQFIVYAAYGEVMHQFQVFEMTLWRFLSRWIKTGTSMDQAMEKAGKWDATTFGKMVRGLKSQTHWPDGVIDSLDGAVQTRNYLAHHFLREYFLVMHSHVAKEQATQQLAAVSVRLRDLEEALEVHLRSLGVASFDELDEETKAEIDKLRPTVWLGESDQR
jgi:hypothetical protein